MINRSKELELIDYSIKKTKTKVSTSEKYIPNIIDYLVSKSLSNYLFEGKANGFTRDNSARKCMESLNPDIVNKEMLKNIVKITALKDYNHEVVLKGTTKSIGDDLTINELEYMSYTMIKKMNKDDILQVCFQYPKFYQELMFSFVYRRYFDQIHDKDQIDDSKIIKGEYKLLLDKIDNEYSVKKTVGY